MTGGPRGDSVPGTPGDSDALESPPQDGLDSPNSLDMPKLRVLERGPPLDATLSGISYAHVGTLVHRCLRNQGMETIRDLAEFKGREPYVPGLGSPRNVVVGERGILVNRTRTRWARAWAGVSGMIALGAAVTLFGVPGLFRQLSGPEFTGLALVFVLGFTYFILRCRTVDFRSEVTCVAYGPPPEAPAAGKHLIGLPGTYRLKVWAGVARSENYWAKYGLGGRSVEQIHPSPETAKGARELVASLQEAATETALP